MPHPCLDQAISYLEQVNSQIRSILNDLPPSLRNQGVYHIVDTGTDKFAESTFINVHKFISVPEGLDMSEDACSAIFFVLSGALENIERHSGAQSAAVVVRPVGAAIQLAILDNGRGFSAPQTALGAMRSSRAGLRFMYDWADAVGGALQISSVQGRSTRVVLTVPTEGNGKK